MHAYNSETPHPDDVLIEALGRADRHAIADARRRLRPQIVGWCRRIAGVQLDQHHVEDLADDIFYDFVLDCAERVVDGRAMWAYLKVMSTRRTRRLLANRGQHRDYDAVCFDRGQDESGAFGFAVDRHRLATCLERLTARARRVLELRFCLDLKDPEIGRRLSVSSQYTGRVRKKALAQLRGCMENPDE